MRLFFGLANKTVVGMDNRVRTRVFFPWHRTGNAGVKSESRSLANNDSKTFLNLWDLTGRQRQMVIPMKYVITKEFSSSKRKLSNLIERERFSLASPFEGKIGQINGLLILKLNVRIRPSNK